MKTLYLIRHGQAEDKGSKPDFDRNLDNEGKQEAKRTGQKLLIDKIRPDLILSSPANRALQTAAIVAETIGYKVDSIALDQDIYYTSVKELLDVIHRQDDTLNTILLAGHNPSITFLASVLTETFKDSLPTAGLVAFEADADSWGNFEKSGPEFLFKIYP